MKMPNPFGGTSRKVQPDPTQRQVGNFSATPGVNAFKNNATQFSPGHKKVVRGTGVPTLRTKSFSRPNIKGKVDNRKVEL